jgi:hypothetical protein
MFAGFSAGEYELSTEFYDAALGRRAGKVNFRIRDENIVLPRWTVEPTINLRGRVHIAGGDAETNAYDLARLGILLSARDLPPERFYAQERARINDGGTRGPVIERDGGVSSDGAFQLLDVPRGTFHVVTSSNTSRALKLVSVKFDGREALHSGITVSGAEQANIELFLAPRASLGTLDFVVLDADGHPTPRSTVVLAPSADRRSQDADFLVTTTDQFGSFRFEGILAGEYRAIAWDHIELREWQDAEILAGAEGRGEKVTVQHGFHLNTTVRLQSVRK